MPRKIDLEAEYQKRLTEAARKHKAALEDAEKIYKDRLERIEIWKKAEEAHELSRKKPEQKEEKKEEKAPEPESESEPESKEEVRLETAEEKQERLAKYVRIFKGLIKRDGVKGFAPADDLLPQWEQAIQELEEEEKKEENVPLPNPPTYTYVPLTQFEKPPPILSDTKVRKPPKTVAPR